MPGPVWPNFRMCQGAFLPPAQRVTHVAGEPKLVRVLQDPL